MQFGKIERIIAAAGGIATVITLYSLFQFQGGDGNPKGQELIIDSISAPQELFVDEEGEFKVFASGGNEASYDYTWNFRDGNTKSGQTVKHSYSNPDEYTIEVTVEDGENKKTQTRSIRIEPIVGLAIELAPMEDRVAVGEEVEFLVDITGGKQPYEVQWDFNGDVKAGNPVSYIFTERGTYDVTVTVLDNGTSRDSISRQVTAEVLAPSLKIVNFDVKRGSVTLQECLERANMPGPQECDPCNSFGNPEPCDYVVITGGVHNEGNAKAIDCNAIVAIYLGPVLTGPRGEDNRIAEPEAKLQDVLVGGDQFFVLEYKYPESGDYSFYGHVECSNGRSLEKDPDASITMFPVEHT